MSDQYNTAALVQQIEKRLGLTKNEVYALHNELSQLSNGPVKEAFAAFLNEAVPVKMHRYAVYIKSEYVNASYQPASGCEYVEIEEPKLFIGVVEAETPIRAVQIAGAQHRINPEILGLYEL